MIISSIYMKIECYKQTIKLNKYDKLCILGLLKNQEMNPAQISKFFKMKKHRGDFSAACKKLSDMKVQFDYDGKKRNIFIKKQYRGIRRKGYNYSINMEALLTLVFYYGRLDLWFKDDAISDMKDSLKALFIEHAHRKINPNTKLDYIFEYILSACVEVRPLNFRMSDSDRERQAKKIKELIAYAEAYKKRGITDLTDFKG